MNKVNLIHTIINIHSNEKKKITEISLSSINPHTTFNRRFLNKHELYISRLIRQNGSPRIHFNLSLATGASIIHAYNVYILEQYVQSRRRGTRLIAGAR